MPKKKKQENSAENYFPVDEEDLKHTTLKINKEISLKAKKIIEKPAREKEIEIIEKAIKKTRKPKKSLKRKNKKIAKKTITKEKKYIPPKITLKDKGYELIITEKPQAAAKIAEALSDEKIIKNYYNKVPYYEINRKGKKIIIVSAVGHLFTLSQNSKGSDFPVFDISWKPNFQVKKGDFTKKYYDAILRLCKKAGSITIATDYDVEGEVIGMNVVKLLCNQPNASRMKFSTLTKKEINESYEHKLPSIAWGQAIAGETRHYLDWFYGINLSRALMNAIKSTGKFKIMSIGRVQGPTLKLIVHKEREIQNFKPKPYWQIFITIQDPKTNNQVELRYIKDIFNEKELEKFKNLKGKKAQAETKKSQQSLPPNPPFNLTTLQTEAYKLYGISPSKTLQIAQGLYLSGLISYPRTSSQKLPSNIDYKTILQKLAKKYKAEHLIKRKKPVEGSKTDPAHPSIYPTGNFQILSGQDEKIYNLIVKRFLSLFCEDAIIEKKIITAKVDNLKFNTKGHQILKKSWMELYPNKFKENEIPDFNGIMNIINQRIENKETHPPKRYSPASIISELEKRNLGTKATRASILETLYDRNYIQDTSIKATPLGISIISMLEKYSPIIIDESLTREFEKEMQKIEDSKNTEKLKEKEQKVLNKAKKTITQISKVFKEKEKEIGKELVEATNAYRKELKEQNKIMPCPKCKKGYLAITYSPKNKKYFIACDNYPECKNTFSLPPYGIIKKINPEKKCEKCNYPLLMAIRKSKKPWIFCFNPECEKNKERIEAYKQKNHKN